MLYFSLVILTIIISLSIASPVGAVCPVCTIAVAAGLGLSRYLGIDDAISGLWVGGLLLSSSFWLNTWLESKKIKFKFMILPVCALIYGVTLLPLWQTGIIGHSANRFAGIDKLLFGTIVGSLVFLIGVLTDKEIRKLEGHQLLPFQKVAFPLASLIIMSVVMYLIPK